MHPTEAKSPRAAGGPGSAVLGPGRGLLGLLGLAAQAQAARPRSHRKGPSGLPDMPELRTVIWTMPPNGFAWAFRHNLVEQPWILGLSFLHDDTRLHTRAFRIHSPSSAKEIQDSGLRARVS